MPPQGHVTLTLALRGLLRYRHRFPQRDGRAQALGESDTWCLEPVSAQRLAELDVQVAPGATGISR